MTNRFICKLAATVNWLSVPKVSEHLKMAATQTAKRRLAGFCTEVCFGLPYLLIGLVFHC